MLNVIIAVLTFFFFLNVLYKTLFWLHMWQIKEYRIDRLMVHLRETIQGRSLLRGKASIIRLLLIFSYFFLVYYNILTLYSALVLFFFFIVLFDKKSVLFDRRIKVPEFTTKILFIFLTTCAFSFLMYIFSPIDIAFWVLILDFLIPFFIAAQIVLFSIPADLTRDITINRAIKKRENLKNLMVIGITGSYGKGSTKEYMSAILSKKFKVVKTKDTYNTPIGIARTILTDLTSKTKIFIVEMGAYKKGEVRFMCNMVHPLIGVLTAVNEQHVSLFGSIENTMKAKYELIDSIPNNGISLFNANNPNALKLYKRTRKKRVLYETSYNDRSSTADIQARSIKVSAFSLSFTLFLRGRNIGFFKTNLIGRHHIENLLPGIWVAEKMGMTNAEIKKALLTIFPFNKTMEPYVSGSHTVLIDDTFNANPASVHAEIEYLTVMKGKKALVFQPMIELGETAAYYHYEIGKHVGRVCTDLFLTNKNFLKEIQKGVKESKKSVRVEVLTPTEISYYISNFSQDDGVVFEGKEAAGAFVLVEKRKVFGS